MSTNNFIQLPQQSGSPSGTAGGDLSGTYPNPSVATVGGVPAATIAEATTYAADGDIIQRQAGIPTSVSRLSDSSNNSSVDFTNRVLDSGTNTTTVDWDNLHLANGGGTVLDWSSGILYSTSDSSLSVDWTGRTLDVGGSSVIDWGIQFLFSDDGLNSLSWNQRILIKPGSGPVVDWSSGLLTDFFSIVSADWQNRLLYDPTQNTSVDYGNRALFSPSAEIILDWNACTLSDASGTVVLNFNSTSALTFPGAIGSYNGNTLAGNGVTSIPGSVAALAQTASISIATLAAPTGHLYRVNVVLLSDVAGTSGTVSCAITYKDPTATSHTINPAGTLTLGTGTLGNSTQGSTVISCDASTNIQYATTLTSPVGSPKYNLYISLERLQ